MVEIDKDYIFEGPEGKASLLDLFDGRSQLIVGHFMFHSDWEKGCPSCSAGADEFSDNHLKNLHARDTSFVYVSRAPLPKLEAYKAENGWTFPWYSSYGSDFNYDFHVTLDEAMTPVMYNYRNKAEHEKMGTSVYVEGEQPIEGPGRSSFLRIGDRVFHTYSVYARGLKQPEADEELFKYSRNLVDENARQFEKQCEIFEMQGAVDARKRSLYFSAALQGIMVMISTYPWQFPVEEVKQQIIDEFCLS